jgi:hypothetical protein
MLQTKKTQGFSAVTLSSLIDTGAVLIAASVVYF